MKKLSKREFSPLYLLTYATVAMFFFVFNPQGTSSTYYGSGGGRYADRVDSFSEYIVRNTIKRNILNNDDFSLLPILTKGYNNEDYNYYPNDYQKYYSNPILQTIPATFIAKILKLNTEKKLDIFFNLLRLTNAFLLAISVTCLYFIFCRAHGLNMEFMAPLLAGCSSGFILFSQNLYFASFLIIAPALLAATQLTIRGNFNKSMIAFLGALYFLRGYEFATILALLTAFSIAIFTPGDIQTKAKSSALGFMMICLAFLISIMIHMAFVWADDRSWSLVDVTRQTFANVRHRTASTSGVPFPFSTKFLATMNERWEHSAFSISSSGLIISEFTIIMLMMIGLIIRLGKLSITERLIYLYGFLGYASWYICAYQHIMWHHMYDWYIFSLTIGLSFSLLLLLYGSIVTQHIHSMYLSFQKKG